MGRYRIAAIAQSDLDSVWDYIGISQGQPDAAHRQLELLRQRFSLLGEYPLLGERREELRPLLRSHVVGSYVILYYPLGNGIEVVGVVHAARDLAAVFRSGDR